MSYDWVFVIKITYDPIKMYKKPIKTSVKMIKNNKEKKIDEKMNENGKICDFN